MLLPQATHAQSAVGSARGKLNAIGGITGLGQVDVSHDAGLYTKISAIINILLGFIGVVALVYILYAGFRWITASGNEDQVTEARNNIRNAVIGLVVVFLAFVITNYVITALIGII
ncbi:MAG: pilin [Patescibacteria group bacterium]|nr:pilin [Patescibacteria group bacterium]